MDIERATRRQIMVELQKLNVDFDDEATVLQLRSLYWAHQDDIQPATVQPHGLSITQQAALQQQQQLDTSSQQQQEQPQQQPAALTQQPVVSTQQPTASTQWSAALASTQQPVVSTQQPAALTQQPTASTLQSATATQQPGKQIQRSGAVSQQQPAQLQIVPELHNQQHTEVHSHQQQRPAVYNPTFQTEGWHQEEAQLDQLLAIAKKKKELMKLQAELAMVECKGIDLLTLDAMVNKFDGSRCQDVTKWLLDLENIFEMFQYSSRDQLVAARHLLEGHAKLLVEITPVMSYRELKDVLLDEFRRAFTVQDVFKMLKARTLKPGETIRQYVLEMQYVASRAEVPEADLIDFIIEGINDKTAYGAILFGATSLAELKLLIDRYERKRTGMRENLAVSTGVRPKTYGQIQSTTAIGAIPKPSTTDLSAIRCYNCYRYGHYQSTCPAPRREPTACFICNKVGHINNSVHYAKAEMLELQSQRILRK